MPKKEEKKVEAPVEEPAQEESEDQHVVHHLERRDGGTNWNESKQLPSLDDEGQS